MRVVLDTSVWISALLWTGTPHRLIELAEGGVITICATTEILAELRGVLERERFARKLAECQTTVHEVLAAVLHLVTLYPTSPVQGIIPADPDDDMFVACALSAQADCIVSGDQHLLQLRQYGGIEVLAPRAFLERFSPETLQPK